MISAMIYTVEHIARIIGVERPPANQQQISYLLTDSRKLIFPDQTIFFALDGVRREGADFVADLYEKGVRSFVVKKGGGHQSFPDASLLEVPDVLAALQQLAAFHRQQFNIPVIGITGSNGKTIVKEWLFQLLHPFQSIIRSPRSYNSQLGVPLSVWQMNEAHTLGIFEAGISQPGEMNKLEAVIQPTIGIWTNIGVAHNEGFISEREKALEKAKLFQHVSTLIYCSDALAPYLYPATSDRHLFPASATLFSWSRQAGADLQVLQEIQEQNSTRITAIHQHKTIELSIPFTDRPSVDNAVTCWAVLLSMGVDQSSIAERIQSLEAVDMRMQLKKAINNCYLLNDSYSNDIGSLTLALDFLTQQAGTKPTTLILSDMLQTGIVPQDLYKHIIELLLNKGIRRLIGIGPEFMSQQAAIQAQLHQSRHKGISVLLYRTTEEFLQQTTTQQFRDEYILLKGARIFAFETISHWLEQKVHQTVLEVNLTAMAHNLKAYQQQLEPTTKIMVMVKAFSYGSGSAEVARILQFHKVDYLAVAYADEGVELRKAGISLPIMVMNVDEAAFDTMIQHALEPEIYSQAIYQSFHQFLDKQAITQYPVHIKVNTGMNRLGFELAEIETLAAQLQQDGTMIVRSVMSHLAASEDPNMDSFTSEQVTIFKQACTVLSKHLSYSFIQHIANSAGIFRHPEYQFDMVRLGIGLYGVDSANEHQLSLQTVAVLRTTIAQIRKVPAGETVGYNRKGVLHRESLIATVRIGYADGYNRRLGNGVGIMHVLGQPAPVVGNVCMDMTMLDVTDIPGVREGDMVEVFGHHTTVQDIARATGTIAYEVLTGVSQRVKRIYIEE
jgi:alanine racemase